MDGPIFLPSGGNEQNLKVFDITTNYFVKLFIRSLENIEFATLD